MTPDRWSQIEELYHAALAQPAEARAAFLAEACPDLDVRRDVESLLAQSASGQLATGGAAALAPDLERAVTGSSLVGRRIGVYEIRALVGIGGMGEVYRARDTRLGRDVAIKTLPQAFTSDPERLARFEREARLLASLNHPNIATIFGLEEGDGVRALVMELVDGPTLAERVAQGPMPMTKALTIAHQIAEALEAAHEKGIIHRDLKPANIKLTREGTVKVLDFGLAKVYLGDAPGIDLSQLPTVTATDLQAGRIVGTPAYMSPEQARGQTTDKRTDIWAFACVLYEILTGRSAFAGNTVSDTIARILEREPDWSALPATLPVNVRRLLRRCLEKDLGRRQRDIGDARIELDDISAPEVTSPVSAGATRHRGREYLGWAAATLAAVLAVALAIPALRYLRETPPPAPPETRVEIVTPATDWPTDFALSPDGRQIVFVASGDGASRLWLRSLATTTAQPLAGTEGATFPFWSPDSRAIGFFAGNALKRLDVVSGGGAAPQILAPAIAGRGGTWNADGVIVFAPSLGATPLMRVSATGGAAVAVTTLGPQQLGHIAPHFLPDSRRFLFYVRGAPDTAGIYLGTLDGSAPVRLTPADGAGVYLSTGRLLWVRAGTLVAQRLDVAQAALTGEPMTLADGVPVDTSTFQSAVSVAATGLVAYRTGAASQRQLTWFDRSGTARGTVGDPDATLMYPRVSPDGHRVVVRRTVQGNQDLWLLDGARTSRFTVDAAVDSWPVWSPDSSRIVFRSTRTGAGDLYQKLTGGSGVEERLMASDQDGLPNSWSADGRFVLYFSNDPQSNSDLWVVPTEGDHTPSVVLKTPFREAFGVFSPDDRWIAYQSNESGRPEIYVRPFVPPGAAGTAAAATGSQVLVSTAGGIMPVWRPDGKELFYLNPAGAMMAAPITVTGATLAPGAPVLLFPTRIVGGGADVQVGRNYDVASDGRFLINTELDSATAPITLLMNWNPEGKR